MVPDECGALRPATRGEWPPPGGWAWLCQATSSGWAWLCQASPCQAHGLPEGMTPDETTTQAGAAERLA